MSSVHDIYIIKQIGNGYLVTVNEDYVVETCDKEYIDAVSRLLTHLTNKINKLQEAK